ncbi:type VII secretion integral membrane protein EccD [Streptomyces sp. NPDC002523]
MTTPVQTARGTAPDVCRITVEGPAGRADLAVPVTLPLSSLLPLLLRQAGMPDGEGRTWRLQRLGEEPLDPDGTPQTLGLRHGEVLWMRPEEEVLPALHFDDVADGVAHVVSGLPGRWSPHATRWLSLAAACLTIAALVAELLVTPGAGAAAEAGGGALLLGGGAVAAQRLGARKAVSLVAGCGALVLGMLAGFVSHPGADGGFVPGLSGVLLAAVWVAVLAVPLLVLRAMPYPVPGTALGLAAAAALSCGLILGAGCSAAQATALVAGLAYVLGQLAPRAALRLARLHVPQLPHDADELQQDIEPQPEEIVQSRVALAGALLDVLSLTSAVVYATSWWLLVRSGGWIGWVFPLVFSVTVLLRARELTGVIQRVSTALAGATGPILVLLVTVAPHGTGPRFAALAGLLAAIALLLVAAERLPDRRLLPIWGHIGDIGEWVTAIALLPLLLQIVHAYSFMRSLAG